MSIIRIEITEKLTKKFFLELTSSDKISIHFKSFYVQSYEFNTFNSFENNIIIFQKLFEVNVYI